MDIHNVVVAETRSRHNILCYAMDIDIVIQGYTFDTLVVYILRYSKDNQLTRILTSCYAASLHIRRVF